MKAELLDGAPPGTIAICHPSGWIQSDIFVHWLSHFIANVKPTKNDPVLLLLDGHGTQGSQSLSQPERTAISLQPSTSKQSASSCLTFSHADILPKPRVARKSTSNPHRGKSAIITSSPYKTELEESNAKKQIKKKLPKPSGGISNPKKKRISDDKCIYCTEIYGNTRRSDAWVQCLQCKRWAHESSTGWELKDLDEFQCFRC
ncbi:unnamed protein product [Arctia plantaginis]|uniref:DDE-1 domain-containing protein n=1 Tax=Arctia plantaginis TaxID=874455 RepID=A0A8S1AIW1_ARCPL|nr:unnamed protein product [Arctia plantaginis]